MTYEAWRVEAVGWATAGAMPLEIMNAGEMSGLQSRGDVNPGLEQDSSPRAGA